jgi:hypothetical protein
MEIIRIDREAKIMLLEIIRTGMVTDEQRNKLASALGLPFIHLHYAERAEEIDAITNTVPELL